MSKREDDENTSMLIIMYLIERRYAHPRSQNSFHEDKMEMGIFQPDQSKNWPI